MPTTQLALPATWAMDCWRGISSGKGRSWKSSIRRSRMLRMQVHYLSMRDKSTDFFHSRQEICESHHYLLPESLPSLSFHLRQRLLCLGEPERHRHGAVQRDGCRQLAARRLPLTRLRIQRPEATVAVRLEWAHA